MLVIGVGSEDRGDDALGLVLARRLAARVPRGVRVVEHGGEALGLIEAWRGEEHVLILDAACSGRLPGSVFRLDALHQPLPAKLMRASTHDLGVAEAIELARVLGILPRRLQLWGVEGGSFVQGRPLSAAVLKCLDTLVEEILLDCHA